MRISIAMATYNGARYLQEQLQSFVEQHRLPDELVVSDDGSDDETVKIVEKFAKVAPFDVRVSLNDGERGYAENFDRAIQQCSGDVIFLSDQDDVWLPEKLERVEAEFLRSPETLLVMNDAELVHADGRPTGLTKLKQTLALGLSDCDFVTGCCMAVRSSMIPLISPVPSDVFVHDTWINRLALALRVKTVIPEVMQHYRRHGRNTSAWIASRTEKVNQLDLVREYGRKDPRPFCVRRLKQLEALEQRLQESTEVVRDSLGSSDRLTNVFEQLKRERVAVEARMQLLQRARWQRPLPALGAWLRGQYRFFSGWKSLAKDLIQPSQGSGSAQP